LPLSQMRLDGVIAASERIHDQAHSTDRKRSEARN
jgi:hypothetical protein